MLAAKPIKATKVANGFKTFTLKPEDLQLLTQNQREFAEVLLIEHGKNKAKRYIENCVKVRKGLCVYCNSSNVGIVSPDPFNKTIRQKQAQFRCKDCKQYF